MKLYMTGCNDASSSCLVFQYGVRDFRGYEGAVFIMVRSLLMKLGYASASPHAPDFSPRFVTFVGT